MKRKKFKIEEENFSYVSMLLVNQYSMHLVLVGLNKVMVLDP
jgi:hypothetical protein